MVLDNHELFHKEAGLFEKQFSARLHAFLKDEAESNIEKIASLLSYLRMKANEIIKDTDSVLEGLEQGEISRMFDSLFLTKSDIDFFVEEAEKLKEALVELINEVEKRVDQSESV